MKTCPQCGQAQADDVKFCINCGYKFPEAVAAAQPQPGPQPQPQPQAGPQPKSVPTPPPAPSETNETLAKAKHASANYWSWLIRSVSHPSNDEIGGNRFFGLVSLGLIALFNTLAIVKPLANAANTASGMVSDAESSVNSLFGTSSTAASTYAAHAAGSLIFGTGLRMLILFFVVNILVFSFAYLAQSAISPVKFGYLNAMTEFGRYLALPVFFSAVSAVIGFLGGLVALPFTIILLSLGASFEGIAFYEIALSHGKRQGGLDSLYSIFFVTLLLGIVLAMVMAMFGGTILHMIGNVF